MHLEAHAGAGWLLGNLVPRADRALRNWCVAAAVLPDADAITYLFGPQTYVRWHHTLGHNVWVGLVLAGLAVWHQRARGWRRAALVGSLVALSFAVHVATDAKLSAYATKLFWPFSHTEYEFANNLGLAAPINTWLVYASLASVVAIAVWRRVTPLDVFWPRLDRLLIDAFGPPRFECGACGRACNHRCDACGSPTCLRHARVQRGFHLRCTTCSEG